ncbi:MAG: toll/interleukin-1 receptor domain-containing protein [Kineosporiaceae bacterium]
MAQSVLSTSGRVFISYRREETAYAAGWLYDRLAEHFGEDQVFKDVDSIEMGDDFVKVITTAVGSCDVLLALIGDRWLTITDEQGARRLDQPDDFVRREIEAALTRDVRVVPILVEGARMPRTEELPQSLVPLVRRQALELSPSRFSFDTGRLLTVLDRTLAEVQAARGNGTAGTTVHGQIQADASPTPVDRAEQRVGGRRPLQRQATVTAGVAAALATALIVAVIVSATRTPRTTTVSTPPTSTASAPSPTSAPSTSMQAITPTAAAAVRVQDDFTDNANGWMVSGTSPSTGRITDGAYRVTVAPSAGGAAAGAFPEAAAGVYPVAPSDVRIEVDGRRLSSSERQM